MFIGKVSWVKVLAILLPLGMVSKMTLDVRWVIE